MKETAPAKTCIVIAGPTAVGKTAYAIKLAQELQTAIISADSRQCYIEMNIGVAKPSAQELATVPHFFVNSHHVTTHVSAADFEKYALEKAATLFEIHDTIVMVGGTGLYIKAFTDGLDELPETDPSIRTSLNQLLEEKGLRALQEMLQEKDPAYWSQGEIQNPRRIMRALEVILSTGNSIVTYQRGAPKKRDFDIVKKSIEMPREQLYERINQRVDKMMEEGLLEEVKSLLPYRHLSALQTVGYQEIFDHLDGHISLEEAVALIKRNSRHYAKRQITWFKKEGFTP